MDFGNWLTEKIRDSRNTRQEIAKLSGIPKNKLNLLCSGSLPSPYQSKKLSKALNIGFDEIEDMVSGGGNQSLNPVKSHSKVDLSSKTVPNQIKSDYKTPLQPIKDKTCVITGRPNPVRAHYDGPAQHIFGKGLSVKSDNLFVAEIDHELHMEYHDPKEPKSIERSHDFLVAILLTIKRKAENGQIIFKK